MLLRGPKEATAQVSKSQGKAPAPMSASFVVRVGHCGEDSFFLGV